jgi:hypothetical protein
MDSQRPFALAIGISSSELSEAMVCSVDRLALDRCKALNEARETEGMWKPRLPSARPRENRGKNEKNRSADFRAGWREFNLDSRRAKESLKKAEKLGGKEFKKERLRVFGMKSLMHLSAVMQLP